ncbi:MAG: penicillin-binding transpeptidase domain-containing protein, partial [Cyclobacteriaceae bacterium]
NGKHGWAVAQEERLPEKVKPLPNHAYHLLYRSIAEGHGQTPVRSTLRADWQYAVQQRVERYSQHMAANEIHNTAAIILDIQTGNTLAYVGNSNNPGRHGQHVDIITSRRSPGSLLKPFLYAAALDDGLIAPHQLLPDIPIFYKGFAPKNFDKEYRGAVPANDALISSLNVPFVHLLIEYGYEKFHQKLKTMGFTTFDRPAEHYGLSLILGGAETTLWEISGVYASMARAMYKFDRRPFHREYSPDDYKENTYIFPNQKNTKSQSLSSDGYLRVPSIRFTLEAMQKLQRPYEEAGWKSFQSARPISWKTGTSYGFRDAWAIGLNSKYVIAVWVGNADGEGRPGLTGVSAAAPLLFDLFGLVDGNHELVQPFGMPKKICQHSGMLASPVCPQTYELPLPEFMVSSPACSYHRIIHLNQAGTHQVNNRCYALAQSRKEPWFILPPAQAWYYKKYHANYRKPPSYLPGCIPAQEDRQFELIYPRHTNKVHIPREQSGQRGLAVFEAAQQDKTARIYWHLDEQYLGVTQGRHQQGIQSAPGPHTLTLVDDSGSEIKLNFEILE